MTNSKLYTAALQASKRMQKLQRNSIYASLLTNVVRDEYLSNPRVSHKTSQLFALQRAPTQTIYRPSRVTGEAIRPFRHPRRLPFPRYIQMHVMANEQPQSSRVYRTSGDKYTGLAMIFPRARGNQACSVPHLPPGADVRSLSRPRCCQTRIGTCARVRGKWCSCCSRTAPLDWCNPDGWRSPPSWRVCLPDAGTNRHDWLGWRVAALGYVLTTLAELRGEVLGCELSKGELDGNLKTWRFADGVLGWEFQVTCLIE